MADHRFEIPAQRHLGMVVFRLKGDNELTEKLLKRLNHRGNQHAVPASLKGKYVIRFTITSARTSNDDIIKDWNEIRLVATEILTECNVKIDRRVPLKGIYNSRYSALLYEFAPAQHTLFHRHRWDIQTPFLWIILVARIKYRWCLSSLIIFSRNDSIIIMSFSRILFSFAKSFTHYIYLYPQKNRHVNLYSSTCKGFLEKSIEFWAWQQNECENSL